MAGIPPYRTGPSRIVEHRTSSSRWHSTPSQTSPATAKTCGSSGRASRRSREARRRAAFLLGPCQPPLRSASVVRPSDATAIGSLTCSSCARHRLVPIQPAPPPHIRVGDEDGDNEEDHLY